MPFQLIQPNTCCPNLPCLPAYRKQAAGKLRQAGLPAACSLRRKKLASKSLERRQAGLRPRLACVLHTRMAFHAWRLTRRFRSGRPGRFCWGVPASYVGKTKGLFSRPRAPTYPHSAVAALFRGRAFGPRTFPVAPAALAHVFRAPNSPGGHDGTCPDPVGSRAVSSEKSSGLQSLCDRQCFAGGHGFSRAVTRAKSRRL